MRDSAESKAKLDHLILGCFAVQKLYGRDPGSIEAAVQVFHTVLAAFPADKVTRSFEVWMQRNQEFPTPADIVSLIRRNGKPPLAKEVYISASKKDPEMRTSADWAYIREYEAEQWADEFGSPEQEKPAREENTRLRVRNRELEAENRRLVALLAEERKMPLVRPVIPEDEKIRRTIEFMRESGASQEAIMEFVNAAEVSQPTKGANP